MSASDETKRHRRREKEFLQFHDTLLGGGSLTYHRLSVASPHYARSRSERF